MKRLNRIRFGLSAAVIGAGLVLGAVSANAQQRATALQGKTAEVDGVEVGQRIDDRKKPEVRSTTARIQNRIHNRIENCIRNRVDRTYDVEADTTSAYERAEDRNRTTQQPR